MALTTREILQLLPMDEDFRKELLETFDSASEEQQFRLSLVAWQQYYAYKNLKLKENIQVNLAKPASDTDAPDEDFFKKVEEKTGKELTSETTTAASATKLDEVRKAMEKIVKEIQAAKLGKN